VERIYEALSKLASATLVSGLIVIMTLVLNSGQLYPNNSGGDFTPSFFESLLFAVSQLLAVVVSYLMSGVALMGIVVAWADHRRVWMLAIAGTVIVAVFFPATLTFGGSFFAIHPRIGRLIGQNVTLLIYVLSLVPVTLALAFARLRGGGRTTLRAEGDAMLEITRSRL